MSPGYGIVSDVWLGLVVVMHEVHDLRLLERESDMNRPTAIVILLASCAGCGGQESEALRQPIYSARTASTLEKEGSEIVRLAGVIRAEQNLMKRFPYVLETPEGRVYVLQVSQLRGLPLDKPYTISGYLTTQDNISMIDGLDIEGWQQVWERSEPAGIDPFN